MAANYLVRFRLYGTVVGPDEITLRLGLVPLDFQEKGATKPNGHGTYDQNYWAYGGENSTDLVCIIESLLKQIEARANVLIELLKYGGSGDFFVGVFLADDQAGLELRPALLQRISELGASIVFDIYR